MNLPAYYNSQLLLEIKKILNANSLSENIAETIYNGNITFSRIIDKDNSDEIRYQLIHIGYGNISIVEILETIVVEDNMEKIIAMISRWIGKLEIYGIEFMTFL